MTNVEDTILSQYANSPTIVSLIEKLNLAIDPSADIDSFYNNVWNIDTAVGFGLDIWGKIVGVSRYLKINSNLYFGFQDNAGDTYPFGQQSFNSGAGSTSVYALSDDAYRTLILTKALSNIVATTSPAINSVLQQLFASRGRCYVSDQGNMQMRYTFEFTLTSAEMSIMQNGGVLPRPAGVQATMAVIPANSTFGFAEAGMSSQPFGQGTFFSTGAILNVA